MHDHWGYQNVDAAGQIRMYGAGAFDGIGWPFYNGGDAPQGSYLITTTNAVDSSSNFTLPVALQAGVQYRIFIHAYGYDFFSTIEANCGGATSTVVTLDDREGSNINLWTEVMLITPVSTSNQMSLTVRRTTTDNKCNLLGLFITTNPNVVMNKDGYIVNLTWPPATDSSAAVKGNLIANGDWEAGVGAADWAVSTNSRLTMADIISTDTPFSGTKCIKLPIGSAAYASGVLGSEIGISSRVYHLKPGKTYTFSAYVKCAVGTVAAVFRMVNTFDPPTVTTVTAGGTGYSTNSGIGVTGGSGSGMIVSITANAGAVTKVTIASMGNGAYHKSDVLTVDFGDHNATFQLTFEPKYSQGVGFTATTTWTRQQFTVPAYAYPSSEYIFSLNSNGQEGNSIYFDQIQLEEGNITAYAPSTPVEVIASHPNAGHVWWNDDVQQLSLSLYNGTAQPVSGNVRWEVYDHRDILRGSGTVPFTVSGLTTAGSSINVASIARLGFFRLVYWVENVDGTEKEITYSVIPHPPTTGLDTDSYLGIHPNFDAANLATVQRLGIKWGRAMSPDGLFRWPVVQSTCGAILNFSSALTLGESYGVKCLANIGGVAPGSSSHPACADDGTGKPLLSAWSSFCSDLATLYGSQLEYIEVWNEPLHYLSADFYGQLLYTAITAIRPILPNAKFIGVGGESYDRIQLVIAAMQARYPTFNLAGEVWAWALHSYPGGNNIDAGTALVGLPAFVNESMVGRRTRIAGSVTTEGTPASNPLRIFDQQGFFRGSSTTRSVSSAISGSRIMNTETAAWDFGGFLGPFSNFTLWGDTFFPMRQSQRFATAMQDNVNAIMTNFVRTIAAKAIGYYLYDSRLGQAAPDNFVQGTSIIEHDRSVKPKGIVYACAGQLIDKSTGYGNVSPDINSVFSLLDPPTADPIVMMFSSDNTSRQIVLSGVTHSQLQVLDQMGNDESFSGTTIRYGREPIFLRGIGMSASQLQQVLKAGVVSTVTDTDPPNVVIVDGPRGPIPEPGIFRMRVHAIDKVSYPNVGEVNLEAGGAANAPDPDAVLYSYQLEGYSGYSAWTGTTVYDYSNIPRGLYNFNVKAKDAAGNESAVVTRQIQVGELLAPLNRALLILE